MSIDYVPKAVVGIWLQGSEFDPKWGCHDTSVTRYDQFTGAPKDLTLRKWGWTYRDIFYEDSEEGYERLIALIEKHSGAPFHSVEDERTTSGVLGFALHDTETEEGVREAFTRAREVLGDRVRLRSFVHMSA